MNSKGPVYGWGWDLVSDSEPVTEVNEVIRNYCHLERKARPLGHDCLQAVTSHEIVSILSWDQELESGLRTFCTRLNLDPFRYASLDWDSPEEIFIMIMEQWCSQETSRLKHSPCVLTLVDILNEIGHVECASAMEDYFNKFLNKTRAPSLVGTVKRFKCEVQKVEIADGDTDNDYVFVFARFLDENVTCATLVDPYIRTKIQIENFKEFLSVLRKGCPNLVKIKLVTGIDSISRKEKIIRKGIQSSLQYQFRELAELAKQVRKTKNLKGVRMNLRLVYDLAIHDRSLRLNNGWNITLGRGLDYFYTPAKNHLARTDYKLRRCKLTSISGERPTNDDCEVKET